MIFESLKNFDTNIFLFLNGLHNSFFDEIMHWLSNKFIWIPLYLIIIYFIIKYYKKQSIIIILLGILVIVTADQIASGLLKNLVQRPRPCHEPSLEAYIHLVRNECGGMYSFASSHAANSFGFAVYTLHFLKKKFVLYAAFMLIWASLVSYSRIYLGVHYPADVLCGALIGSLCAYFYIKIAVKVFKLK